jgi:hypothetical protein
MEGQVTLAEFNALSDQTKRIQARLEELEQQRNEKEHTSLLDEDTVEANKDRDVAVNRLLTESQVEELYDDFELPADTYTLLMTEPIWSVPFFAGFIAPSISAACLILAFQNEWDNGSPGNPLGVPAGIRSSVRAAQFLGVSIGILTEEEIPTALVIIGKRAEQERHAGIAWHRILLPSILRMCIGYMFIFCLFLTVVQEDSVLDVFFGKLSFSFL